MFKQRSSRFNQQFSKSGSGLTINTIFIICYTIYDFGNEYIFYFTCKKKNTVKKHNFICTSDCRLAISELT